MIIVSGSTSQSIDVQIVDDSGLPVTGLTNATFPTVKYSIAGANADVTITLASLATTTTAYASGGVVERGEGVYRLDLPNAALSSTGRLTIRGEATGKRLICPKITVIAMNVNDAVRAGLTALPNVASGSAGAIITSGSGTAQLNVASGNLSGTVTALVTSMGNSLMSALKNGKTFYNAVSTTPASAGLFVPYQTTSIYNTDWAYLNTTTNYLLWWDSSNSLWTISTTLGTRGTNYWTCATMAGTYTAGGSASGSPILISKADPFDANYSNASYLSDGCANANIVKILGTLITGTAAYIAAGFSYFFNVASPSVTVANGSTYGGGDTSGTTTLLSRVTGAVPLASDYTPTRAAKLDNLDATVSSRTSPSDTQTVDKTGYALTSAYDSAKTAASESNATTNKNTIVAAIGASSAPTAVQIRQEIDSNSTQLQTIVSNTSGGATITVISPMSSDGAKLYITQGDSYSTTMGNQISFNIVGETGLIGSVPHLRLDGYTDDLAVAPEITSGTQTVTFDAVAKTVTAALTPGTVRYQIRFENGSSKNTPIAGVCVITPGL